MMGQNEVSGLDMLREKECKEDGKEPGSGGAGGGGVGDSGGAGGGYARRLELSIPVFPHGRPEPAGLGYFPLTGQSALIIPHGCYFLIQRVLPPVLNGSTWAVLKLEGQLVGCAGGWSSGRWVFAMAPSSGDSGWV